MTKKILTSYVLLTVLIFAASSVTQVEAAEVTGTLSSVSSSNTETGGNLSGTVSNDDGGGSSSGGSRSGGRRGGSSSSTPPPGAVLGISTTTTTTIYTPGFPNAGEGPDDAGIVSTLWSDIVSYLRNIITF